MSRTAKSLRNIKYALVGQVVGLLVSFIGRIVFVQTLTAEHLGVQGLFGSILAILSTAELGVGAAIVYNMYKPLAVDDKHQLLALMRLYRIAYWAIGGAILVLGTALIPLLPLLMQEEPSVDHLNLTFFLFVANSAVVYFFSYKRNFLIADQKRYIATAFRYGFFVVMNLFQIIVLLLTANFLLFVVVQLAFTILENVSTALYVDRLYPFLKTKHDERVPTEERRTIVRNIKALSLQKLGAAFIGGSDGLILGRLTGVVSVGLYSNYLLITQALSVVFNVGFASLTASVGNLGAQEPVKKQLATFRVVDLAVFWVYAVASIGLLALFNPFIEIWLGASYLFEWPIVLVIVLNFFLIGMRNSIWVFRDAKGIFWADRYRPVVEVIVKVIFSIFLGIEFGVVGVLLGTTLELIIICLPIEARMLYKYGFHMSSRSYYASFARRTVIAAMMGAVTIYLCSLVPWVGIWGFVAKGLICLIVTNAGMLLLYWRTEEFKRLWALARRRSRAAD